MTPENPLAASTFFPAFDRIAPEHAVPAVRAAIATATTAADALEAAFTPTWDGLMAPLHRLCEPLHDAWGIVNHLLSVMNNDAWREAQQTLQPDVVAFSLRIAQSRRFYDGYRAIRSAGLSDPAQRRVLDAAIRAAEQTGVGLDGEPRDRFNAIQRDLAEAGNAFTNAVLDAIKAYSLWIRDADGIAGLPPTVRSLAAQAARAADEPAATPEAGPWRITLDAAVTAPFLMHARNRGHRETLFRAMAAKASSAPCDNSSRVEQILALRREKATLLGYPHFAAVSLANKMAGTVEAVDALTAQLADASRDAAARETALLLDFAREHGFADTELRPWDRAFWVERLIEARYRYSDEELRAYFQFPLVLDGLFALAQRLFDIRIVPADGDAPVWHPDVRLFRVEDPDGAPRAWFYVDPYSRPATKRSGAWMNDFHTRARLPGGGLRHPLALIVCNQTPPADGRPSLMRLSEVQTLFHEFGHALQHMLTTIDEPEASGINTVEWDAVEIASQFMENWCYDRATLTSLSRHIETGTTLPGSLFDAIIAARNVMAASGMLRQLYLGATDMDLHARYPRPGAADADAVKRATAARFLPFSLLPEDRLLCSFSHIFAGGYAAGYYSYKWAEVLAADAFAAFEEAGLDNNDAIRATGRRFRDTFLALGGSVHPMAVFQSFRGRPPAIEPLLRHAGLR
jgi:oligopeptidase A